MRIKLTDHAHTRLIERDIDLGKVKQAITTPFSQKRNEDGSIVARKKFEDGQIMKVVYTEHSTYILIHTFYYENYIR